MKKITMILTLVFVVGMLALGSMVPGQAWASNDDQPELAPPPGSDDQGIIFEQNDSPNGSHEGDPDTTLDGADFLGEGMFNGWDFDIPSFEALLELFFAQVIPAP